MRVHFDYFYLDFIPNLQMRMRIRLLVGVEIWEHAETNFRSIILNRKNQIRFLIELNYSFAIRFFSYNSSFSLHIHEFLTEVCYVLVWINIKNSTSKCLALLIFLFWFLVIHDKPSLHLWGFFRFDLSYYSIIFDKLYFSIHFRANS